MKTKKYSKVALVAAAAASLASCSENAWNNRLPGFEEQEAAAIANVQRIDYTLTAADYKAIADNSANKALAGELSSQLAAVGTTGCFTGEITAAKYVPAFLSSTAFKYFTLSQGSAINLTYNVQNNAPEAVTDYIGAGRYTVSKDDYSTEVWESSEDYIQAFSPSHPADAYIPTLLADHIDGDTNPRVVVTYNQAEMDPVFGTIGAGGETPAGPQELLNTTFGDGTLDPWTVETILKPDVIDAVWTADSYGYAKGNSYKDGALAADAWLISPVVDLTGCTDATLTFDHVYNKFPSAEFAKEHCTLNVRVEGETSWTTLEIPVVTDNTSWTMVNAGIVDLGAFEGKKIRVGFHYTALDGESGTWEIKNFILNATKGAAKAPARAAAFEVPAQAVNAVYCYDGSDWAPASSDYIVLAPGEYANMGQTYANLSTNEPYLSIYLNRLYPYAAEGAKKYVLWLHYNGGTTAYDCSEYVFGADGWTYNNYVTEETSQFVNVDGEWVYDPSITLELPAGKGQELSTLYFQACVDWVYENICVPLGDTSITSGKFYVSKFGNNEYYAGTSAYQGNLDLRPDKAREQYPAGYEGLSDDEIVELEKERFLNEVMPGALAKLHPNIKPEEGIDVTVTITFGVYTGTTTNYTAVWKVTGPATFEPVSCDW